MGLTTTTSNVCDCIVLGFRELLNVADLTTMQNFVGDSALDNTEVGLVLGGVLMNFDWTMVNFDGCDSFHLGFPSVVVGYSLRSPKYNG